MVLNMQRYHDMSSLLMVVMTTGSRYQSPPVLGAPEPAAVHAFGEMWRVTFPGRTRCRFPRSLFDFCTATGADLEQTVTKRPGVPGGRHRLVSDSFRKLTSGLLWSSSAHLPPSLRRARLWPASSEDSLPAEAWMCVQERHESANLLSWSDGSLASEPEPRLSAN